jgi:hypothetical protein
MKKLFLLVWMLVGLLSSTPTVEAKGAWMDLGPPELPRGQVWVQKIWVSNVLDTRPKDTREPAMRWDLIVPPAICFMLGGLFALGVVRQFRSASMPPKKHA